MTKYRLLYVPNYTKDELVFGDYDTRNEAQDTGAVLVGVSSWRIEEYTLKKTLMKSWDGNRSVIAFEVTRDELLKLLPGIYESVAEFRKLRPGNYVFSTLEKWLNEKVK
jgi:hypothetical protein